MTDSAAVSVPPFRRTYLAEAVLVTAVILAWWNSLTTPPVFDDFGAITTNATIRQFSTALTPPTDGSTATGRPLFNLTLALNHAISQEQTWSYHVLNTLIHAAATLLLFGLVRRTVATPVGAQSCCAQLQGRSKTAPLQFDTTALAFVIALLWGLHPLQTESVTCIAQRTESLCGLFYLGVVYGLARSIPPGVGGALCPDIAAPNQSGHKAPPTMARSHGWLWLMLSVTACLAGMATKEVMVTAPVLALLYDRTFLAGSFSAAWRQRRGYYLALAATWLLLAWLVLGGGGTRGYSAGLDLGVTPWEYLLTQSKAVLLYLKLSVWPHPLVLDYGEGIVTSWREVWWQGPVVLALLAATGWALWRRPVLGFLGAWFFIILSPSSSVVPLVSQTIAEHRMYLPLAAILALGLGAVAARLGPRTFLAAGLGLALAAGLATRQRNGIFQDEQALWEDVIHHLPANGRAHNNLGRVHFQEGRMAEAVACYRESLRLESGNPYAHLNLGLALMKLDRPGEAGASLAEAVRLEPTLLSAHLNLGTVLTKLGRAAEALPHFATALQLGFRQWEIHFHWGVALAQLGRWPDAIAHYAECLRLNPRHVEAYSNWGTALMAMHDLPGAMDKFETALRLRPELPEVHFNLGVACTAAGRPADAIRHYEETVRLDPAHALAQLNLGIALAQAGRLPEAIARLVEAVRLQPDSPEAQSNLGVALGLAGRQGDALAAYQAALRLRPGDAQAHYNVGFALLEAGREAEARSCFETALRLRPDFPAAREILKHLPEIGPR